MALVSVQWKRLPTSNEPPAARAYHSMNCVGSRYLLFGGFDGKSTYGDLWWLVPEGTTSFPFMESSRKLASLVFHNVLFGFFSLQMILLQRGLAHLLPKLFQKEMQPWKKRYECRNDFPPSLFIVRDV